MLEFLGVLVVLAFPFMVLAAFILSIGARRRVRDSEDYLRRRLNAMQRQLDDLTAAPRPVEPEPKPVQPEAKPPPVVAAPPAPPPPAPVAPKPAPPQRPAPAPVPPPPPAPTREPVAPRLTLEERIGGRWFNWVGILAILFGVAYAMKYSFDQGWVSPTMRFWGGQMFGLGLLAAGVLAQRREYAVLARGFWGGGIGVLFLVFFAGFKLLFVDGEPVIGRGVAFAGMAATVAVGVALAIVYDTRTAAVLSAVGGYLTPVLLSTGEADQVFLFTYLSILTAGLLALGFLKRWVFLRALTFGVVVCYFAGWWITQGMGAPVTMLVYTSLMFLLFSSEVVLWSAVLRIVDTGWSYFLLGLNTTLHTLVGFTVLDVHYPEWKGAFLLATAAYHLGAALLVRRRHGEDRLLMLCLGHGAAALFLLAPVVEPRVVLHWLPIAWALQGAALFASERWGGGGHLRGWGYAAFGAAAVRLLAWVTPDTLVEVDPYLPFWNVRGFTYAVAIAAFGYACWRTREVERAREGAAPLENLAGTVLWIAALSLPAVLLSLELSQALDTYVAPAAEEGAAAAAAYEHQSSHWMTLLWASYATLVATVTGRRGAPMLRTVALAFGAFVIGKYVVHDLAMTYTTQDTPLFNSRLCVTAALAACCFWLAREFRFLAASAAVAAHVLVVLGLSMEWVDLCHVRGLRAGFWRDAPLVGVTLLMQAYGVALAWRGRGVLAATGVVFVVVAAAKWLALDVPQPDFADALFLQLRFLAGAATVAACYFVAGRGVPLLVADGVRLMGQFVVVVAMSMEIRDLFQRQAWDAASTLSIQAKGGWVVVALWGLYGLGAFRFGQKNQRPYLRAFGLVFVALALFVGLMLAPGAEQAGRVLLNTRVLGLGAAVAGLLGAAAVYRRAGWAADRPLRIAGNTESAGWGVPLTLAAHALAMLVLTLEATDYFRRAGVHAFGADWIDPENAKQLSHSLLWALYAIGLVVAGLLRKYRPVRLMALAVLVGTIGKVFLFDLSFLENPYRMFSFFVLGGILVGVSFLYQKYKAYLV